MERSAELSSVSILHCLCVTPRRSSPAVAGGESRPFWLSAERSEAAPGHPRFNLLLVAERTCAAIHLTSGLGDEHLRSLRRFRSTVAQSGRSKHPAGTNP